MSAPRLSRRPSRMLACSVRALAVRPQPKLEQLSGERRPHPECRLTPRSYAIVAADVDRNDQGATGGGSGEVAGSGGLPRGVDWVASEVPAPLTRWTMRHLAAAALARLGVVRRGVRASPVLTLPATCVAQGHASRAGCRRRHQDTYLRDVLRPTPVSSCTHQRTVHSAEHQAPIDAVECRFSCERGGDAGRAPVQCRNG
jgi:hypothetical protein